MQIEKLTIKKYKILESFSVNYNQQISVFIGINGSGKSTILEALALIFSTAHEQIVNKRKIISAIQDCEVEYLLRFETQKDEESMQTTFNTDYLPVKLIIDEKGEANVFINIKEETDPRLFRYFSKKYRGKDLLPQRIIIYYSGISNHMADIYKVSENNILKQLRTNPEMTKDGYILPVSIPIFLFQPEDYLLLLASLSAFAYNTRIDDIFYRKLKLQQPAGNFITIEISKIEYDKEFERNRRREIEDDILVIEDNAYEGDINDLRLQFLKDLEDSRVQNFFGASGRLGAFLMQLRESSSNKNESFDSRENKYFFHFTLGQWQALSEDVIKDPKKIFEFLFMLKHNGLLNNILIRVVKNDTEVDANLLSEGEKQLVIISALNEVLGVNNCVFLFDEPDNFLHPSLQDDLVRNIEENYGDGEAYQNHYFVTTHNPSFLNNLDPDKGELYIMRNGKTLPHNLKWFGRDVNEVVYQIMNSEYRPIWALQAISDIDQLIDENDIEKAKLQLNELTKKFSETDSEIVRLHSKLDFFVD